MADLVATAETEIDAPPSRVWRALTDPDLIEQYMFGARVVTDWQPGSSIVWKGEYEGKAYEDKGEVLEVVPERRLRMTHFSPLGGEDDVPENYHTVRYELAGSDSGTAVRLTQDGCDTEEQAEQFSQNWQGMLDGLKKVAEG